MARPKGSKNKAIGGGNPQFNLKDAKPVNPGWQDVAPAAYTNEDAELDRHLAALAADLPPPVSDPEPMGAGMARKEIERREMLGDVVDGYRPASTDEDLRTQVHLAKQEGCDSIEATVPLAKRFCRDPQLEKVGYFIYHNIKVYLEGHFEQTKSRDSQTIEQRLFGASK